MRHPNVPKRGSGPSSTVVCNHVGFVECLNFVCTPLNPSFTPKSEVQKLPIVGNIAEGIQSLYIDRAGSEEEKNQLVQRIIDRQEDIEVGCKTYPPLMIFAEGTTTNGTRIIPFKRGAFQGMRTVTPSFCQMSKRMISPPYECLDFMPHQVLMLSQLVVRSSKIIIMPEFTPTPFMLEKFADKGQGEPWKIFAWCVRDSICKHSGLKPLNEPCKYQDKKGFCNLMNGVVDKAIINGQTFEYEKDTPKQSVKISKPNLLKRLRTMTYSLAGKAKDKLKGLIITEEELLTARSNCNITETSQDGDQGHAVIDSDSECSLDISLTNSEVYS